MQDISGSSHVHKDIEHPIGPLLYTISCMHCMTVSLAQGGEGLGAVWGEEKAREYLPEARFSLYHDTPPCTRHPEQLVRGDEVSPDLLRVPLTGVETPRLQEKRGSPESTE